MNLDIYSIDYDVLTLSPTESGAFDFLVNILKELDLLGRVELLAFSDFVSKVYRQYAKHSYHNMIHALDVTHILFLLLSRGGGSSYLSEKEMLMLFVAAIVHDAGHKGVTNAYLVQAKDPLVEQFGEESTLEKYAYHLCKEILGDFRSNIFQRWGAEAQKEAMTTLHELIIATDLLHHRSLLEQLEKKQLTLAKLQQGDLSAEDRLLAMKLLLKLADLGNTIRSFETGRLWGGKMFEESLLQGDLEKEHGWEVPDDRDRERADLHKIEQNFYSKIIFPFIDQIAPLIENSEFFFTKGQESYKKWREEADRFKASSG